MQRNKKINLILFLCLLLLAMAAYLVKTKNGQSQYIFFPIDVNNIQNIIIQQTPELELQKTGSEWKLLRPETGIVNEAAMQKLLDALATPLFGEYKLSEVSLKELSLKPPNLRVLIDGKALEFGSLAATEQMHYVRFQNKVYLSSPFLLIRFSQRAAEFLKSDDKNGNMVEENQTDGHSH